jgi:hypothetical protein
VVISMTFARGLGWGIVSLLVLAQVAFAGGPRFVTGTAYTNNAGNPMAFYTTQPMYFTDPGALNANVTKAQADAMVAAAAAVWNVPSASLVLMQGGSLSEHVSSVNTYFNGSGVVFPADVQATNYLAIPIAVIYDTDGSVTDLLLGEGASQPSECPWSGVTESVDALDQVKGTINHAVIVLNGRCVGSAPQQMLQMQYQLARAFGRVLGLAWAQLNDNVFTGSPAATLNQMNNWPLMHPIDIVCGPYTYQCMTNPFTLRADDLSTLAMLYPQSSYGGGKEPSLADSMMFWCSVNFPNGQGMEDVNLVATRWTYKEATWEPWEIVSGATGYAYQQNTGNPVTGPEPASENVGTWNASWEGAVVLARVPVEGSSNLRFTAEPINPLYSQEHAIGPYQRPELAMSGSSTSVYGWLWPANLDIYLPMTVADAASSCNTGNDGSEQSPAAFDPSGWWSGLLCGAAHSSWWNVNVKANHSWTIEVTALDGTGAATVQKAQPVIGVWNASDMTGILPTVAAEATPMNSMSLGMTQLRMSAAAGDASLRVSMSDAFGAGRPDFAYKARVLYADNVSPAAVANSGGQITVNGMGFRLGNQVLVNGVKATVVSWTSTQIVAVAPSMTAAGAGTAAVSVEVWDASTGGVSLIPGALIYNAPVRHVTINGGPEYLASGASASWNVTLQATQDGTAAAGVAVAWTFGGSLSGSALSGITDGSGDVTMAVVANSVASGSTNTLTGCAWTTVCASWTVYGVDASLWALSVASGAGQSVANPAKLGTVTLLVTDGVGHAVQGVPVNVYQTAYAWEETCASRCPAAPVLASSQTTMISDANGMVQVAPYQQLGVPQVLKIAASAGTQGFVSTALSVTP